MTASEALYFDKSPVAHIVQYDDHKRMARIQANNQAAMRRHIARGTR